DSWQRFPRAHARAGTLGRAVRAARLERPAVRGLVARGCSERQYPVRADDVARADRAAARVREPRDGRGRRGLSARVARWLSAPRSLTGLVEGSTRATLSSLRRAQGPCFVSGRTPPGRGTRPRVPRHARARPARSLASARA